MKHFGAGADCITLESLPILRLTSNQRSAEAKVFLGNLAVFAMAATIGLLPAADLQVYVGQVGEAAQGPEALA